ncbi:MAG: radical SAM protein [Cyanobacteriota bacterium]|nr:radical SAM protein [Cyanobacteriota bacterium]
MQGPTGSEFRVLQIHPSLRCNLRCQHCYSSSSPELTQELPLELILQAVSDARTEGYNVLGVSGGEPLLYKPLTQVLQHARKLGMTTSITTNGILLNQQKIEDLREHVNLIAISLDGVAQSHNQMRGTPQAFELMTRCLEDLRKADVCFGFIFTLTLDFIFVILS